MKIEKLSKEATIRELAMRLDELIDAHNESKEPKISHANPNCLDSSRCRPHGEEGPVSYQEPKALEEKDTHGSCACDEKGICKKLGDVLKIVIESNWPDEVKLKETDKVITEHRYHDKPQDEPKECCENGNLNQEHQCLKQPCHQESETEVKECPYGCSHHKVLGYCGKCPNPCSGDYIILPRPKGMRIGQSIENFLRFAKKVGLLEDAFYYRDEEVLEMWSDFLKSLEK